MSITLSSRPARTMIADANAAVSAPATTSGSTVTPTKRRYSAVKKMLQANQARIVGITLYPPTRAERCNAAPSRLRGVRWARQRAPLVR